jgi:hypothetical protein
LGRISILQRKDRSELCETPRLENLVTFGECDPRLLAPGPDMQRWPHPGRVIQRACQDANYAVVRRAANRAPAFRADPQRHGPPAVGSALEESLLNPAEPEPVLWYDYSNSEGAAAQTLAILAMAGVDQLRRFGDLVADLAALAAAALRKFHGTCLLHSQVFDDGLDNNDNTTPPQPGNCPRSDFAATTPGWEPIQD